MSADATPPRSGTGLIGTTLSGRYRLDGKLGSGGMSTVYLAMDATLERRVAIKVLHREMSDQPDQLERFRRESRTVAQLSHPNVVAVIDAGDDAGHPYIVFEYVEGETLKERIDRLGRLPLDEVAAYGIEIGRGLQAAHQAAMVHRDVKPQNVLIDSDGRAKVTDFGIALSLDSDGLTKTGRVLGTTDYVSPEQAMGREVDARSDIYSLGVLLWEMLIGDVPFKAETLVGVAMKHVNEEMPDVQKRRPGVSAALSAVIERATRKEPRKRYPDMGAMLADLEAALEVEIARAGGSSGEATTVLNSVPSRRRILSARTVSVAGILMVLAAVVAALLVVGLGGDEGTKRERGEGPAAPPSGGEVELASATDFDPEGDDAEGSDQVDLAIDGNPSGTSWTAETYQAGPVIAEATNPPKQGVGLIVETAEPVAAREIEVSTDAPGWSGQIYGAADGPPADLAGWGEPLAEFTAEEESTAITLTATDPATYYLIWITELTESDDGFSASIANVALFD
jgi:eukaryotic-like serine/threonine-protein kinase